MDMNRIEAAVDATRCAASRVANAKREALALKDATAQIITARDEWARYQEAKRLSERAEKVAQDALASYEEASNHWRDVEEATNAHAKDPVAALARRTARCAYTQANRDINFVSALLHDVKQNCKDAREV